VLLVCEIAVAGQASWEELMRRSEKLLDEGKLGDAETVLLTAVKTAEVFGATDRRLAETQHSLGRVYAELGKLPEAEKWYQRSLSAWTASMKHDPKLPTPLISLASLYLENGLHSKAERLVDPWLRDPNFKLNAADPLSVSLFHEFAGLKYVQRRYSEAEPLYRQVLSAAEIARNPSLQVSVLNNLGLLLAQTGRSKEAGSYLERALAIQEGAQTPNEIDLARSLTNLGAFYRSIREYAKAEPLLQRALTLAESNLGAENRLVGQILAEYALLLHKTKRKNEAKVLEIRAQAIRQGHAVDDLGRHTIDFRDLLTSPDARRIDKR
jgi:tetratricopeptide (TPR) repeat protein